MPNSRTYLSMYFISLAGILVIVYWKVNTEPHVVPPIASSHFLSEGILKSPKHKPILFCLRI